MTRETNGTDTIYYRYDNNGKLIAMNLNGTEYYYFRNAQGDVMGLFDSDGDVVVEYTYDAWGKILSVTGTLATTVGAKNPYRYRGYRYDSESGLYYLQSRYYNPETSRCLNADDQINSGILGTNLFAYCNNNPVNYYDPDGRGAVAIVAAVGVIVGAALAVRFALSISMYLYAVTGSHFLSSRNFSAWYDPIGRIMRDRLSYSKTLGTRIDSYISTLKSLYPNITYQKGYTYSYRKSESINFTDDLDLAYSVGKARCTLMVTTDFSKHWLTRKTRFIVTVVLNDVYDFHKLSSSEAGFIKRTINNYFGYWPQNIGVLKPYNWTITYSFEYYK